MNQVLFHLSVPTTGQGLFDVTEAVCAWVKEQGVSTGLLTVWCRHTSASLLVQANADPEVQADMEAFFVRLAPEGRGLYRHEEEGLDNMPAHLRAALTAVQVVVPVEHGRPVFGEFQSLYLFEHRGGKHRRELVLHLSGTP
jgi:secondary thiamine-phosphate synthase enzyme